MFAQFATALHDPGEHRWMTRGICEPAVVFYFREKPPEGGPIKFTLPSNTTDYTAVCPGVFFGKTVNNPYYNLLGDHYFCLTRDASGYSLVTGGEAIELIRQVNGMGGAEKPEKLPPEK